MISILERYKNIVASYEIKKFRQFGGAHEFVASVSLTDDSTLHIRDYIFLDGSRKYAYHWHDRNQNLLRRWDNAEHHGHLATFPFHVHTPTGIEDSPPMTLAKVLEYIKASMMEK